MHLLLQTKHKQQSMSNYSSYNKNYQSTPINLNKNHHLDILSAKTTDYMPSKYYSQINFQNQSIRSGRQTIKEGLQANKKSYSKISQSKYQTQKKKKESQYENLFQSSEGFRGRDYGKSRLDDQTASVRFYQPNLSKSKVYQYNSAGLLSNNKLNLSAVNNGNNFQLSNGYDQSNQIKKSNRGEALQNKSSIQLMDTIKKSNKIIAEYQNNSNTKKKINDNNLIYQNKLSSQNLNKKLPRLSEPGLFFQNQQQDIHNKYIQQRQDTKSLMFTNNYKINKSPEISLKRKQSQYSNQAFKKQKQLKETVSTSNSFINNPINKQKIPNFKSYNFIDSSQIKLTDFIKHKQLGSGKFGTVNIVIHKKTGFVCAMKVIPKKIIKQENLINQFIRQIKIQSYLDHPNITKLYGFFDDKDNIYLLLELASEGQLYKFLKQRQKFTQSSVIYIMKQLCDAIRYLHSLNIIHRDIKPENIIIQYGTIKLCDFGWAVHKGGQLRSTFCGTPLYVSPQILQGQMYDQKIDIWSIGILSYQLLVGQIPFQIQNQMQLIKIIKEQIVFPSSLNISNEAKDFVLKILKRNPQERLKIGKLLDHPFLQGDSTTIRF